MQPKRIFFNNFFQLIFQGETVVFVKGAFDCVLELCDSYRSVDNTRKALDPYIRSRILEGARGLGSTGLRGKIFKRLCSMYAIYIQNFQ